MAPASSPAERVVVDDCRGMLLVYSDGAVERKPSPGFATPVRDDGSVEWKDAVFDPTHGLSLRLYRPARHALLAGGEKRKRLPVFFYYHGGGFCIGSRTWPNCHNYCLRLSSDLDALVVAPDYRLAPEFPLPAAFLDAQSSLLWLASSSAAADPWINDVADFTRVFVSGDSAGGMIAHHLAVYFSGGEVGPIRVAGYVQLMPFYGGVERTPSEAACPDDAFLNLALNDRYWRLSLPVGATADHPYANPFADERSAGELAAAEFAPTMVVVGGRDLLRDRAVGYAERMREMGKPVEVVEFEGQQHGFFTIDPWSDAAGELMLAVKRFVDSDGGRRAPAVVGLTDS